MAVKDILLLGDPKLYEKSVPVEKSELKELLPQFNLMFETVLDFREKYGAGRAISAPQIGLLKRIVCINIDKPIAIINPELKIPGNEMIELWDDCMSFPNLFVKVKRHKKLTLSFYDLNWEKQTWQLEDDMAELIQHEFDHLDGILAVQRAVDNKSFRWKPSD
ncbi:peptide deformylase [Maribellus comscasis]|uniref:Peptide deformylase n=1 Tax=Maribellus comscasis TaxID=2681766 RepID=A0A6I6JY83_9BACT|nr:peptide deformylase [Maribellus comscasis]QGY45177.1 peptide deformylase [Maribellus comscasis]